MNSIRSKNLTSFRHHVYWHITKRCNLKCKHCLARSSPGAGRSDELDYSGALTAIDRLSAFNAQTVIISGGEPLIRDDIIPIIRAITENNIYVSLTTNGLLIDDTFISFLTDLQRRCLIDLTVSLDGGTEFSHEMIRGKGTFNKALKILNVLHKCNIRFKIQSVISSLSCSTIRQLMNLSRSLSPNLQTLQLSFLQPVGRGKSLFENIGMSPVQMNKFIQVISSNLSKIDFNVILKCPPALIPPSCLSLFKNQRKCNIWMGCNFPKMSLLPNGDITLCAFSNSNNDKHFGSILKHDLNEMHRSSFFSDLASKYNLNELLSGVCSDCVWKSKCRGSCRLFAYEHSGSLDAPSPLCSYLSDNGLFPDVYRISNVLSGNQRN